MPGSRRILTGVVLGCVTLLAACQDEARECLAAAASTPSGELVWEQAFNASMQDRGWAIAVDRCSGRVAVGGQINERQTGSSDMWLGALSHDGEPLWDLQVHEKYSEHASSLAFDDDGALLVAGATELGPDVGSGRWGGWLARFDEAYSEQWRVHSLADDTDDSLQLGALALAEDGRMYVAGHRTTRSSTAVIAFAEARDPAGALLWRHDLGGETASTSFGDVLVLPDGELLLVGGYRLFGPEVERALVVLRLTAAGELVSEQRWTDLPGAHRSAALSADGDSILVATSSPGWLGELALDGTLRRDAWFANSHYPHDIAVGVEGDVYVVGRHGLESPDFAVLGEGVPWLVRLDRDLVPKWEHTLLDREGTANAVHVGPTGDAFVIGTVLAPPPVPSVSINHDIWVARFAR